MRSKKLNCWEYMGCGREPRGRNVDELGVCQAAMNTTFSGINSGKCAGRFCWAVTGTLCEGKIQGTFAEKRESCVDCDFFKMVRAEEGTANLRTKFLKFIPLHAESPLLDKMTYTRIKSGKRFLTQGEVGDSAFIIQRGSCLLIVEKEGELHPAGHRAEGDIVDMKAVLTGEPRSAHVEAESDMDVWVLDKALFDDISEKDPDLLNFLTELVADRFDSGRPTADRTIGKYVATDIIGRGGYSIVYKGFHGGLNLTAAIKMMRHDLAMNSEFLDNFRNEARIIAGLNHENIIRVYDVEERFRTIFIIMEHLEGESLEELLVRMKTIPPKPAVDFLIRICSAMEYAHGRGIVHRDINPTNIFIQRSNRPKIIDFGLACPPGHDDYLMGGALPYLAPELLDGEPADQRSDIYALGITAYEMATGKRPYPEGDASRLMKMIRAGNIPDPVEKAPDLPDALRAFILRACRRDPAGRPRTMREAMEPL
ncbi:MAG: protein kinase, partial [Desulfobacterales bacterium]|nr:protein kinase [Desulfobacterales bacterium]